MVDRVCGELIQWVDDLWQLEVDWADEILFLKIISIFLIIHVVGLSSHGLGLLKEEVYLNLFDELRIRWVPDNLSSSNLLFHLHATFLDDLKEDYEAVGLAFLV
jgi:hypothetical protein